MNEIQILIQLSFDLSFFDNQITYDSPKMLKLLTDAGAQITQELYDLALKAGAHKIAKIMAAKLNIPEQIQRSFESSKRASLSSMHPTKNYNVKFNFNVNEDAKVNIEL